MIAVNNGTEPGLQSGLFSDDKTARINAWAIIAAGGSGSRLSSYLEGTQKQFLSYKGAPLYWQSVKSLLRCACVKGLILVFPEERLESERARAAELFRKENTSIPWLTAPGGKTRAESARNGVRLLPPECTHVFIHDAARPFLEPELVWRLYESMRPDLGAVIPGLPVIDTVKVVDKSGQVLETPPRDSLRSVQTPQFFNARALKELYAGEGGLSASFTDDAMALERAGRKVLVTPGDPKNVKITNPEDLALLRECGENMTPCVGFGYDVHMFGGSRPLKLGGVLIPGPFTVAAHSDGDVLLHALADALLGCGGLGDIGGHFPDSNPAYDGMSSAVFVDHALSLLGERGIKLTHLDMTVVAQKPKLQAYKTEIGRNIARLCGLEPEQVSVKATTEEGLGFTGRLEGIKAYAVASAVKSPA